MTSPSRRFAAEDIAREVARGGGGLKLEFLLESVLPAATLREIARRHGITVKGYRPEAAPVAKLAPLLAKSEGPILDEVCERIAEWLSTRTRAAGASDAPVATTADVVPPRDPAAKPPARDADQLERDRDAARGDLANAVAQTAQVRGQVDDLQRQLAAEREANARLRGQVRHLESELAALRQGQVSLPRDALAHRIHELERDLDALGEADAGLRRLLSIRETRLREADAQIRELEELVPKGRRRRRRWVAEDEAQGRLRVPHFADSFYRSFVGKDRQSVERALRAVFLLCTEGPAYPGLEVKQIEGQDLWSARAALKLRIYFRMRDDGDFDLLELADREDQHTMLRRLKER